MALNAAQPLSTGDVLAGSLAALAVLAVGLVVWRRERERRVFMAALAWKLAAGTATVAIFVLYYGGNDNVTYHERGVAASAELRTGAGAGLWERLAKGVWIGERVNSTTRFENLSGVLHFVGADSFLATTLVCATLGFAGQLLLYRTFVAHYPERRFRVWWQAGVLFLPSLVLWSAGLFKDTLGVAGLGCAVWGIDRYVERGKVVPMLVCGAGLYVLALYRAQVLAVLLAALVAWLVVAALAETRAAPAGRDEDAAGRRRAQVRRAVIGAAMAVGGVGVVSLGLIESRFSPAGVGEAISFELAQAARRAAAGSNLDAPLLTEVSVRGVLAAWPAALVVTLFRPFLWEAPGPFGLLAALENTAILVFCARAGVLALRRPRIVPRALGEPWVVAGLVFVALMGLVAAVAELNLGTISRYRVPLLPFLTAVLVALEDVARRETATDMDMEMDAARRE